MNLSRSPVRAMCVAPFARVVLFAAVMVASLTLAAVTRADGADPAGGSGGSAGTSGTSGAGAARGSSEADAAHLDPRRYELAGFPIVGGSSDIGVQFGAAATWTHFYDRAFPYLWNIDLLLSASVKDDTAGFRMVQQSHVLRLDAPGLFDGKGRLDARASFQRTINAGYYGLGNASAALVPPGQPNIGRTYQYIQEEGRLRTIVRVHDLLPAPWDFAFGTNLRYEAPSAYPGSQLANDLAAHESDGSPYLTGASSMLLASVSAGLMVDTRDSEFVTRRGIFYQLGVSATVGSEDLASFAEATAVLSHYAPLGKVFIFANRVVASFQMGRVPFYDMAQGGVFEPQYLLGGENGVRGVPMGRYAGRIKAIQNTEIRGTPFPRFTVLGQRIRIGTTVFFDAGRVWSDYRVTSALDGTSLGLKYGVGGGLFLQWGEAAIFRLEAAYSPDAESENPGFPL
ncbi:MAG TPA: BamA/TamA family outer membrane protein, partial [Polyangiaceae bacterium]